MAKYEDYTLEQLREEQLSISMVIKRELKNLAKVRREIHRREADVRAAGKNGDGKLSPSANL